MPEPISLVEIPSAVGLVIVMPLYYFIFVLYESCRFHLKKKKEDKENEKEKEKLCFITTMFAFINLFHFIEHSEFLIQECFKEIGILGNE